MADRIEYGPTDVGDPQCLESEFLQLRCGLGGLGGVAIAQLGTPHADACQIHATILPVYRRTTLGDAVRQTCRETLKSLADTTTTAIAGATGFTKSTGILSVISARR